MEVKILFLVFIFVKGYNEDCPQKCYCGDFIITCDGAVNPVFELDWRVEIFFIQNSHLNNLKQIMSLLRNLKYLTIKDMKSFNCTQLMDVPSNVVINAEDCKITTNQPKGKKTIFPIPYILI